jgi:L-amino acid N-acyltransferase YncA
MAGKLAARPATIPDCDAMARIYNQGIDSRIATFETRHRVPQDIEAWLGTRYPVLVVTSGDEVVGFAATSIYRPRECYAGIAEYSVYVANEAQGRGVGRLAMEALIEAAQAAGFWKLVSRIFPENIASLTLARRVGFREVGTYVNHAQLDGEWKDVVIVERLLVSITDA